RLKAWRNRHPQMPWRNRLPRCDRSALEIALDQAGARPLIRLGTNRCLANWIRQQSRCLALAVAEKHPPRLFCVADSMRTKFQSRPCGSLDEAALGFSR